MAEWIYFLHPPRTDFAATMTPAEQEVWGRHFERLQRLLAEGVLILAGPTLGETNTGVCVFSAPDEDAARQIMNDDPAIASGFATGELRPFRASLLRGRTSVRSPSLVIDCPDAGELARFYAAFLGWEADIDDGWADIRSDNGQCISFQQVDVFTPPSWPDQEHPQQMHLDLVVEDLDSVSAEVIRLGARKHEHQPGKRFRVFLDPAGHPFCLCLD
ncbi:VOC family protein [Actinoplanes sp. NPDC051861]|uniref:VOC family protein n=1 Tax=Actinoplanes sp. NPDC051861 TaxID=3155170 RepID=UPI0034304805